MRGSCRGRLGRDGNVVAELAQLVDGAVARLAATALVEIGRRRLLVALAVARHVVDDDQEAWPTATMAFCRPPRHHCSVAWPAGRPALPSRAWQGQGSRGMRTTK